MKRIAMLAAVCLLMLSVASAHAMPQYLISDTSGRQGYGGPFQITGVTDPSVSFQTFCIEYGEHIYLGGKYYGSIDPLVYYSSGPNSAYSATIDFRTAWLYNYFLDHQSTLSSVEKQLIQNAIWAFQGQRAYGSPDVTSNKYYYNITAYQDTDLTIMALNLWTDNVTDYGHRAQSQLIATPEPGTLLLMGLGLIGLAGLRRKE